MTHEETQTEMPIDPPETPKFNGSKKTIVRNPADGEVTEVIKAETNRKTKKSAVDTITIL